MRRNLEMIKNEADIFVSFDEVILLVLRCMVYSIAEDDLFYKLEMDALIFSEYS